LKHYHKNPRQITKKEFADLRDSLRKFGDLSGIVHNLNTDEIISGNQRIEVFDLSKLQIDITERLPEPDEQGTVATGWVIWEGKRYTYRAVMWDEKQSEEANVRANKAGGSWNFDILANEFSIPDLLEWGFSERELQLGGFDLDQPEGEQEARKTLAEKFIIPPFSVLDARQGYWQDRKRAWIALGIQSEIGRGDNIGAIPPNENDDNGILASPGKYANNGLLGFSEQARKHYKSNAPGGSPRDAATLVNGHTVRGDGAGREIATSYQSQSRLTALQRTGNSRAVVYGTEGNASEQSGTSIFDPVLCEIAYRWFMPKGGRVLDPFAGGSVRGIVASILGHDYIGVDLRHEQITANEEQAQAITQDNKPKWILGDSINIKELAAGEYDFIFSCPPYFDLELYSDNEQDLSNYADYPAFIKAYREIISSCVAMLKVNRFACFIVGDIRDKKGFYRNFPADTISAFQDAGMTLYNEAVLVTAVGSLPIRVGRQFQGYRKLGKTHQNILVFYKGDPKAIKQFGDVECGDPGGVPELVAQKDGD
jgi:DNA modification methylase